MKKGAPRKKEEAPRKKRKEAFTASQFDDLAKEIQEIAGEMKGHAAALRATHRASVEIDGAQKVNEGLLKLRDFSLRAKFKLDLAGIASDE